MRFAALETSTEWCSVALCVGDDLCALEQRAGQRHAELVLPMLDRLLRRSALGADALEAVAFGAGPGSFTGLRIACGVAQGIAMARNLPVLGISTLEALAEESGADRVVACVDARMNEVYSACLERDRSQWRTLGPARCIAPREVARPPAGSGWVGCGSGFAAHPDLAARLGVNVRTGVHPGALAIARLAAPRLAAGEGVDAALAAPFYMRDKVARTIEERAGR
jgi:tRNA threonylcarbamoyladenosine biosynthesis protein TsaB